MDFESKILKLTEEMGFGRIESKMALEDSNGDIDSAVEKLLSGQYQPPPYSQQENNNAGDRGSGAYAGQSSQSQDSPHSHRSGGFHVHLPKFLSPNSERRNPQIEDHPTAPSLSQIDKKVLQAQEGQPPSYEDLSLPPPYEKIEKKSTIQTWERNEGVIHFNEDPQNISGKFQQLQNIWGDGRCAVCYSLFHAQDLTGRTNENIVQKEGKFFHYGCFSKKFGPKCAYCCFPLSQPDKDHELSGQFLKYKNKDYHVECYEKYAGPRCNYCFNVIIEKPNGELSGNWIVDKNQEFHLECYQKKMHSIWRAKNV